MDALFGILKGFLFPFAVLLGLLQAILTNASTFLLFLLGVLVSIGLHNGWLGAAIALGIYVVLFQTNQLIGQIQQVASQINYHARVINDNAPHFHSTLNRIANVFESPPTLYTPTEEEGSTKAGTG